MSTSREPLKRQAVLEDDRWLQQARSGDHQAFERLVEHHGPWLLHLIGRMVRDEHLVQDILQQVWLQLYRSLPTLHAEGTLSAWLARVARNRCLDKLRRTRLLTFSELTAGEEEEMPPGPAARASPAARRTVRAARTAGVHPGSRRCLTLARACDRAPVLICSAQLWRDWAGTPDPRLHRQNHLFPHETVAARVAPARRRARRSQVTPRHSRSHGHLDGARASEMLPEPATPC